MASEQRENLSQNLFIALADLSIESAHVQGQVAKAQCAEVWEA